MRVRMTDVVLLPPDQFLREDAIRGGMDLLLFANTRHLKRADEKLASLGLGRAHHRVLYFVSRRPDLIVAERLSILAISKHAYNRGAKDLIRLGLMKMRPGCRTVC